jgi:hypothetical protein
LIHAVLVYKKGSRYYEKIVSIKKIINPVKTIIMPRSRGTKDRNALVIDRNVPIIKQNIAKMVLNVTSSGSGASLIFINVLLSVFYYIKLNYPCEVSS